MHENRYMPGEMVQLILGVQGGDEESLARLYAVTNPVLVRYLRVVSDADPASLALTTWSTLLHDMSVCVADEDDDWLELAVGTARESALASAIMGSSVTPVPNSAPARQGTDQEPDPVDAGVAMLRACGPAVADVLAMGVVAGLGRDSIARITGQEPTEVLALVQEGQDRLALPLESLMATMRVPGSPAEVGDLPAVLPLFAAQPHAPRPTIATTLASATPSTAAREVATTALAAGAPAAASAATTATTAAASAAAAAADEPSVADLLTWDSPAPATTRVALLPDTRADAPSRLARVGASAAAWTIAVGGLGTAAAMSGVIPAAIESLFGDEGNRPVIVAQGPVRPGEVPSPTDGGLGTSPRPPSPQGPGEPATEPGDPFPTGDGAVVSASAIGFGTATQVVVLPAVLTGSSAPEPAPTTPSQPDATPPTSAPRPVSSGTGTITGAGHAYGHERLKHGTGLAKGRDKAAQAAAKAHAAAARAQAKAAAALARAAAKAAIQAAAQAKAAKSRA